MYIYTYIDIHIDVYIFYILYMYNDTRAYVRRQGNAHTCTLAVSHTNIKPASS